MKYDPSEVLQMNINEFSKVFEKLTPEQKKAVSSYASYLVAQNELESIERMFDIATRKEEHSGSNLIVLSRREN
jgi:hypothetical protein